jgi:hypothetical protein
LSHLIHLFRKFGEGHPNQPTDGAHHPESGSVISKQGLVYGLIDLQLAKQFTPNF